VALLDKVPDRKGVVVGVARGETLVGHVEEGYVLLVLDEVRQFLPLGVGRVDAGRVVRARVEEDDGALGRGRNVGLHAGKVEADRLLVEVAVLLDLEARVARDGAAAMFKGKRRSVDLRRGEASRVLEGRTDMWFPQVGVGR
jgi:hypothetical protein